MISKITDHIYIGALDDVGHPDLMDKVEILFDVRSAFYTEQIDGVETWKINWEVFDNLLKSSVALYNDRVLYFCRAGIDRSPFYVSCLISLMEGIDFLPAYNRVKEHRPQAKSHYGWANEFWQRYLK